MGTLVTLAVPPARHIGLHSRDTVCGLTAIGEPIDACAQGRPFWNMFTLAPMRDQEGHARFFVGVQVCMCMCACVCVAYTRVWRARLGAGAEGGPAAAAAAGRRGSGGGGPGPVYAGGVHAAQRSAMM
jgi:hypothetical protein